MDASQAEIIKHRAIVSARALHGNISMGLVTMGIHLFMALYGLSFLLETPKDMRKGRRRYIVISFVITVLATLNGSTQSAWFFQ
ncbi:hypothetical protein EST38_g7492 [Candolleomyces aberdarensis]|uniref:Uncharacterized protein n=1 Tax=Candolleomyces aberdarensis TaxID=2316362 RepID=A0A4Q2DHW0_9AGAR|nr:hypothetical protein EST38_g7492 [Candolleomyces aberdarensis]